MGNMTATAAGELTIKLTATGNALHSVVSSRMQSLLIPTAR